eukprot:COSAG02_NODE_5788_length_4033_cov_5.314692_2_plen_692_part_00
MAPTNAVIHASEQYKSIVDGRLYFHGFMFCPSTAPHLLKTTRRVSQTDMCHAKGFYGGVLHYRYCNDAAKHLHLLVGGYFVGNESEETHSIANKFTIDALADYDAVIQTDISDGDKGQRAAFLKTFEHAQPLLCMNHAAGPQGMIPGKEARRDYYCAAKACSVEDLQRYKDKFGPAAQSFCRDYEDEHLFIAAAQAGGRHLHGQHTEQGCESQNNVSNKFRSSHSVPQMLWGMLKMHSDQFSRHKVDCMASENANNIVPPTISTDLAKIAAASLTRYPAARCIDVSNKIFEVSNVVNLNALPYVVNLGSDNFDTRCCKVCKRDHKVCQITAAAALKGGVELEDIVHPSDTQAAWTKQLLDPSTPPFTLPAGGSAPTMDTDNVGYSAVKLHPDDTTTTRIWMPPITVRARGRPTTKRQDRLTKPHKKVKRCQTCGVLTADHDSRTCQGLSEVGNDALSLTQTAAATAPVTAAAAVAPPPSTAAGTVSTAAVAPPPSTAAGTVSTAAAAAAPPPSTAAGTVSTAAAAPPLSTAAGTVSTAAAAPPSLISVETHYHISKVLDTRLHLSGTREYLVRWQGCGPEDDTWEAYTKVPADKIEQFCNARHEASTGRLDMSAADVSTVDFVDEDDPAEPDGTYIQRKKVTILSQPSATAVPLSQPAVAAPLLPRIDEDEVAVNAYVSCLVSSTACALAV